jgi:hypothetical protein
MSAGPVKTPDYAERRKSESIVENLPDWALKQLYKNLSDDIRTVQKSMKGDKTLVEQLKKRRDRVKREQDKRKAGVQK